MSILRIFWRGESLFETLCLSVAMRLRVKMRLSKMVLWLLLWQFISISRQFASLGLYSNWEMRRNRKPVSWAPAWPLSSAFQSSALSGWATTYEARPCMPHSRGLAIDLRRLIQKNMNLVGNAFSIPSDLLFVSPARGPTFLCDGEFWTPLQNQAKSFDFHSCSKWKIFNAWLHYQIAGYLGYYN